MNNSIFNGNHYPSYQMPTFSQGPQIPQVPQVPPVPQVSPDPPFQQVQQISQIPQISQDMMDKIIANLFEKKEEANIQCNKEITIQDNQYLNEIQLLEYKDKLERGRRQYHLKLESSSYEVIIKDDSVYYRRIIGDDILKNIKLLSVRGLCSFYYKCCDGKQHTRVLEIKCLDRSEPIILADPHINTDHLLKGLERWGLELNISRRAKKEVMSILLFELEKTGSMHEISRYFGWNKNEKGDWYFEHNPKNTLEEILKYAQ